PDATTSGTARRVISRRPATASGRARVTAPIARADRTTQDTGSSAPARAEAAQMPATIATSVTATPGASGSPAITAITAATAPSVATSGATSATWPIRNARYVSTSPTTLPTPDATSHAAEPGPSR